MVELPGTGFQPVAGLPQTAGLYQLTEDQRQKMYPPVEGLFSFVFIVLHDCFFKFSLRNQIQYLTEQAG